MRVMETMINTAVESDIKDKVLNDHFFAEVCPVCHELIHFIYPCTYIDKKAKLILCLKNNTQFHEEICHKRYVKNIDEFKEKIRIFDALLNDFAVEMCKLKLKRYCEKNDIVESIFFHSFVDDYLWFEVNCELKAIPYENYLDVLDKCSKESMSKVYYVHENHIDEVDELTYNESQ